MIALASVVLPLLVVALLAAAIMGGFHIWPKVKGMVPAPLWAPRALGLLGTLVLIVGFSLAMHAGRTSRAFAAVSGSQFVASRVISANLVVNGTPQPSSTNTPGTVFCNGVANVNGTTKPGNYSDGGNWGRIVLVLSSASAADYSAECAAPNSTSTPAWVRTKLY